MDRRKFLRSIALTGAAFTAMKEADAMSILTQSFETTSATTNYDLVAVLGGEPEAMFMLLHNLQSYCHHTLRLRPDS